MLADLRGRAGRSAPSGRPDPPCVVMRLTEALAEEVNTRGINVNVVLPTVIDTGANRAAMQDSDPTAWVSPDDLAAAFCFLSSPAAPAVNGALMHLRGLS